MIYKYNFKKDGWNKEDFFYVYSPICKEFEEFIQADECIMNSVSEKSGDFSYVSMLTEKKYSKGVKISTQCDFDAYGAPIIVITDSIDDIDGRKIYNLHFEFVAYEDGFNVWRIVPMPQNSQRPINPTKICRTLFKIEGKSRIDL